MNSSITETQKTECTSCGVSLSDEELENPRRDSGGDVICDSCYSDEFEDWCSLCDEVVDKDELEASPGHIVAVYSDAPVRGGDDLKAGYYRVLSWPFFADGMVEGYFIGGTLERLADLDDKGKRAAKDQSCLSGPMCKRCRDRVEGTLAKGRAP